jgi:hypothetical protein
MKTQIRKPSHGRTQYTSEYKQQALQMWRESGRSAATVAHPGPRARENAILRQQIRAEFERSRRTYGSPRITRALGGRRHGYPDGPRLYHLGWRSESSANRIDGKAITNKKLGCAIRIPGRLRPFWLFAVDDQRVPEPAEDRDSGRVGNEPTP